MKRQKQIKESKKMIREALFNIMETKSFKDITMSEIAEKSQVARMTLYRHFKDKKDIIIYCFEEYLHLAIDELNKLDSPELEDLLKFCFKVLKESKYVNLLVSNNQLNQLLKKIWYE